MPVDFVGTHIYAGDKQDKMFGQSGLYSQNDVVPAAMKKVREQIAASKFPKAELWLSEWSSDSPAMIAHSIKGCLQYCHGMSYWQISGTFEEILVPGYVFKEGDNGWGLMSQRAPGVQHLQADEPAGCWSGTWPRFPRRRGFPGPAASAR
ncbi:hypothetical protein LJR219_001814 [Phenylobacterium sp. LjRoot219]